MRENQSSEAADGPPLSAPQREDKEFLSSKEWKKGFLSSKKSSTKKSQPSPTTAGTSKSVGVQSTGSHTRTARGILKTAAQPSPSIQQPQPPLPPAPSQPSRVTPLPSPPPPPAVTTVSAPQEAEPLPPPTKRVSKFMTERMGGVSMIADMNQRPPPASANTTTKSFTGKVMERG
jgi:hypothetical protein